jgi:hypothetical protein
MTAERWDRPIAAFLIALLAGSIFVVLRLESYDWNPTGFVHAGDRFVDARTAPDDLLIRRNDVGFDGTGFYRFSLTPFTRDVVDRGIALDIPSFRHQRILYPLLAWALSGGGHSGAVGWTLIGINLAGFAGLGLVGATTARQLGRHALWGLLFPFYPGFAVSLGLDTAEIVAGFLVLLGILFALRKSWNLAALSFIGSMLSRETTLLIPIGIAAAWGAGHVLRQLDAPRRAREFLAPGAAYVVWQVVLRSWWGAWPLAGGSAVDVAAPLTGLIVAARGWPETDGTQAAYQIILVVAMVAFVASVFVVVRRSTVPNFALIAFGAGTVLALLYSKAIWLHHWGFLRAFTETFLLGAIILLAGGGAALRRVTVASGALWVSIALNLVLHP